jgi:hypothetical protein
MADWIYLAGTGLLTLVLACVLVLRRQASSDLEPVSQHWLAERKRIKDPE